MKAKSAIKSQKELLKKAIEIINDIKREINIIDVYVVGSRARGDYLDTSDLDLVIISDDFKNLRYIERLEKLYKYSKGDIEFFAFTKEEWDNPKSLFIINMKKEAKKLEELLKFYEINF
jgi:predicted nucleotidyltransferase